MTTFSIVVIVAAVAVLGIVVSLIRHIGTLIDVRAAVIVILNDPVSYPRPCTIFTLRHWVNMKLGRTITFADIHTALDWLEEQGTVRTWMADPTPERGNREQRYVELIEETWP